MLKHEAMMGDTVDCKAFDVFEAFTGPWRFNADWSGSAGEGEREEIKEWASDDVGRRSRVDYSVGISNSLVLSGSKEGVPG